MTLAMLGTAPPVAEAAAGLPTLVAATDLTALAVGTTTRVHDRAGRLVLALPRDRDGDRAAMSADDHAARAAHTAERLFDELDIAEEDRESDDALDLVEDDQPLALRRRAPTPLPAEATPGEPAWVTADAEGLLLLVAGSIWRVRAGAPPVCLGPAPRGIRAVAVTLDGTLFVARGADVLARSTRAPAAAWQRRARLAAPPDQLVVDARGSFLAAGSADRIDVVGLDGGARLVFRPRVALRALAACGGQLLALADDGLHAIARDGRVRKLRGPSPEDRIVCGLRPDTPIALFHPGLLVSRDRGRGFVDEAATEPDAAGAAVVVAAAVSPENQIVVFSPARGLAMEAGGDDDLVGSLVGARPPRRSALHALLPYLTLLGRSSNDGDGHRRGVALGLFAEWRLGRNLAHDAGRGDFEKAGFTEGPLPVQAAAPVATESPELGPDRDAACLGRGRTRSVAQALAEPARAASLLARARRSAWLPELRVRLDRRVGRTESLDLKPTAPSDALGFDTDNAIRYEVRATWDLPRLVFNPEELGATQQAARIADMRREIESQVNRLYFERRRLLASPGTPGPDEAATWQIRLEEIEADLDALSGGDFTRCLAGRAQGAL